MLSDVLGPGESEDELVGKAVAALSATFGWPHDATWEAIRQRAGGERDPGSLGLAVAELYQAAVDEGQEPGQEPALAADDGDQDDGGGLVQPGWLCRWPLHRQRGDCPQRQLLPGRARGGVALRSGAGAGRGRQ
jgi:hypothetical protein